MSEIIDNLTGYLNELDNYMDRNNSNRLSRKDRKIFLDISNEYYEIFGEYNKANNNPIPEELFAEMEKFNENIANQDADATDLANDYYTNIKEIAEKLRDTLQRFELLSGVFQKDAAAFNLHDEKIKMLQELVDLEQKMLGEISTQTLEVLAVQHCEVVDGEVREILEPEIATKETNDVPEVIGQIDLQQQIQDFAQNHEKAIDDLKAKTLVVNAYAGPGAGKTTACLSTVAALKKMGFNAEYVPEYAKELVYDSPDMLNGSMENQFKILKEQLRRQDRFLGNVDIIVTDAPILLNAVYLSERTDAYVDMVNKIYSQYENFNFFVNRGEDFVSAGRLQNQEESIQKDNEIKDILKENNIFYGTFNHRTVDNLAEKIKVTYDRVIAAKDQNKEERNKKDMRESQAGTIDINGKEYRVFTEAQLDQMLTEQAQTPKRQRKMLDLSNCYIENYVFKGDMDYISFDGSNFKNCEFRMTKSNHVSYKDTVFADCDLSRSDFANCSFDNADLISTKFYYNLFSECSFDSSIIKKSSIAASNFYKVLFDGTTMDDVYISAFEDNTFIECKSDTVIYRMDDATRDGFQQYTEILKDAFRNDGFTYQVEFTDWQQADRFEKDLENGETKFTVKLFEGESLYGDFECTARINPETFEILDVDTDSAFDKKTAAMLAAQVSDGLWLENGIKETEYLHNGFEALGVNEFLEPKVIVTYSAAPEFKRNQIYTLSEFNARLADLNKEITGAAGERVDFVVGIAEQGMDRPEFLYNQMYMAGHEEADWCTSFLQKFDAHTAQEKRQFRLVSDFVKLHSRINLQLPRMSRDAFRELTKRLKANGAKYDNKNTQWYIMPDNQNMDFFNEYIPGKMQEVKEDTNNAAKESDQSLDTDAEVTPEQFALDGKETYRAYAYMRGNNQKPKPVYGKSAEQIVEKLQSWNKGRTDNMKLQTCYIQKLNPETNKFENVGKWDLTTGKDITPIYLNIPHMDDRNEFKQLVASLKADGAKYNNIKKAFYITRQDDLNKFSAYLPLAGTHNETHKDGSKTERNFTIEPGQEYYDNRVQVTVDGMKPIQIYGDDYDVHFPSMSADETRDIVEKYVLLELQGQYQTQELPSEIEYDGKMYDPLQYNVLKLAEQQHFTKEQMGLIEHPEFSSDRMNEIRFAIRDGLSAEQIAQFANMSYEQWQMDLCRIGLQHGFTMQELQPIINPDGYTPDRWGERRNQLQKMVHDKNRKGSLLSKLDDNKSKVASAQNEKNTVEKDEQKRSLPGNVIE